LNVNHHCLSSKMLFRRIVLNRGLATRGLSHRASNILSSLGISSTDDIPGVYDGQWRGSGDILTSVCPTTGEVLARVRSASPQELHETLERTRETYQLFRGLPDYASSTNIADRCSIDIPAPRRGEILRQIREALAAKVGLSHMT
jgi:aldehyde dehydrogenase family 7 protein A1